LAYVVAIATTNWVGDRLCFLLFLIWLEILSF
jgi:hypothetical protein